MRVARPAWGVLAHAPGRPLTLPLGRFGRRGTKGVFPSAETFRSLCDSFSSSSALRRGRRWSHARSYALDDEDILLDLLLDLNRGSTVVPTVRKFRVARAVVSRAAPCSLASAGVAVLRLAHRAARHREGLRLAHRSHRATSSAARCRCRGAASASDRLRSNLGFGQGCKRGRSARYPYIVAAADATWHVHRFS